MSHIRCCCWWSTSRPAQATEGTKHNSWLFLSTRHDDTLTNRRSEGSNLQYIHTKQPLRTAPIDAATAHVQWALEHVWGKYALLYIEAALPQGRLFRADVCVHDTTARIRKHVPHLYAEPLTNAPTDSVVPLHFQFPPIRYLRAMVGFGDGVDRACVCLWRRAVARKGCVSRQTDADRAGGFAHVIGESTHNAFLHTILFRVLRAPPPIDNRSQKCSEYITPLGRFSMLDVSTAAARHEEGYQCRKGWR